MWNHLSAAYLDPGTGSLIVQTAIAAVLGALVVFRGFWMGLVHRFQAMFRSGKSPQEDHHDEQAP